MSTTLSEQLSGLTDRQQRAFLKAQTRKHNIKRDVALFAAIPAYTGPSPAVVALRVPCECRNCQKRKRFPKYYIVRRFSYECVLEMAAPRDKRHFDGNAPGYQSTSSSPTAFAMEHIRMNRIRIHDGVPLEPESDEALRAEIRAVKRGAK
jgi:hypothetical protein